MTDDTGRPTRQGSSCWLQGCLILAMVLSTVLIGIIFWMLLIRLEESTDRPGMPARPTSAITVPHFG